jgi:hypothetical protein
MAFSSAAGAAPLTNASDKQAERPHQGRGNMIPLLCRAAADSLKSILMFILICATKASRKIFVLRRTRAPVLFWRGFSLLGGGARNAPTQPVKKAEHRPPFGRKEKRLSRRPRPKFTS